MLADTMHDGGGCFFFRAVGATGVFSFGGVWMAITYGGEGGVGLNLVCPLDASVHTRASPGGVYAYQPLPPSDGPTGRWDGFLPKGGSWVCIGDTNPVSFGT